MTEVEAALAALKHCSCRIIFAAEEALHLWKVGSTLNQVADLMLEKLVLKEVVWGNV